MTTYTTKALACAAPFDYAHGEPVDATWDVVVELLFSSGANWEWHDVTGYLLGIDVQRGAPSIGADSAAGAGNIELDSPDYLFAPWNTTADSFAGKGAEFGPDVVWRFGFHDGATSHVKMTGVVEQWKPGGDRLAPTVLLTVTDTVPVLARHRIGAFAPGVGGGDLDDEWNYLLGTLMSWAFGDVNHLAAMTLPAGGGGLGVLFNVSAAEVARLIARSGYCELRADTTGRLITGDVQVTGQVKGVSWYNETRPAVRTFNEHSLILDTFQAVEDTSGVINNADVDNFASEGPSTATDAASITLHGERTESRQDYHTPHAAGLLQAVADIAVGRAGLTDRIVFELDERWMADVVALDLNHDVQVIYAPPGAPAGVIFGDGTEGSCWVRHMRHRVASIGPSYNVSTVYACDVFDTETVTGAYLRTAAGDVLRTAAGDALMTPQRNLIHA